MKDTFGFDYVSHVSIENGKDIKNIAIKISHWGNVGLDIPFGMAISSLENIPVINAERYKNNKIGELHKQILKYIKE